MKLINSFKFAFIGIFLGFRSERNMKTHFMVSLAVLILGFYFNITETEWIAVIIAIALVISAELFNTAIEKIVTSLVKASPEKYEEMGLPKDLAAGAVLVTAIAALAIGLIIFLPYLIKI